MPYTLTAIILSSVRMHVIPTLPQQGVRMFGLDQEDPSQMEVTCVSIYSSVLEKDLLPKAPVRKGFMFSYVSPQDNYITQDLEIG